MNEEVKLALQAKTIRLFHERSLAVGFIKSRIIDRYRLFRGEPINNLEKFWAVPERMADKLIEMGYVPLD